MSTSGFLALYDVDALATVVRPLEDASLETVQRAVRDRSEPDRWDEDVQAAYDGGRETLLGLLFSLQCLGPDFVELRLGRHASLPTLADAAKMLDRSGELSRLITEWHDLPTRLHRGFDDRIVPAPRALLERIWARVKAVAPSVQPMDFDAVSEARVQLPRADEAGYLAFTFHFLGWVVEQTKQSVSYAFEGHPVVGLLPVPPPATKAMQSALEQHGLPVWDTYYLDDVDHERPPVGTFLWSANVTPQVRLAHAYLTVEGVRRFVVWKAPPGWKRFLGMASAPTVDRAGVGNCGDVSCRICRAAQLCASMLAPPSS